MTDTAEAELRPSGRWRRWLLAVAALAALLAAWVAYDLHRASAVWPDEMPALEMPPPAIPVHPESLSRLDALIAAAANLEAAHDARTALLDADEPPTAPLDGWPHDDLAVQTALDAFLATGGLQLPPIVLEAPSDRSFLPVLHVSALRRVRALRRVVEGDPGGAWRDVADVWTLGHRLTHSGAHLLATMVGMAIEEQAVETAHRLLESQGWHAEAAVLSRGLDGAAERPSGLVAALTGECLAADGLYARMGAADAEMLSAEVGTMGAIEPAGPGETRADETWLYDSEKTRAFARRHCLGTIRAAATPAPERTPPPTFDLGERSWASVGPMFDNPIGRTLLAIAQPDFGKYIARGDRLAYQRRSLRLALARAAFTAREGRAPAAGDLVPGELPAMPTDPFTGQPMALDPPPPPPVD